MKHIIYTIVICIMSLNLSAQVIEKDSMTLVKFYQALDGENWYNNTNWLSDKPVSEWYGIYIDGNRVAVISMSDNNLSGNIPSSIGDLDALRTLSLSTEENLIGSIPSEISNCSNLEDLTITVTGISGQIPSELSSLSSLRDCNIYRNNLEGTFPTFLLDLPLEQLDISANNLSGAIPAEISKLKNIRVLSLSRNNFSGVVPPQISQLKNLRALHIRENSLEGDVEMWLKDIPQLYYLTMGNNKFTGAIKPRMFNPDSIRLIDFPNSDISYLEDMSSLSNVTRINCGGTKLNFSDIDRNESILRSLQLFDMQKRLSRDSITIEEGEELIILSDVDGEKTEYKWYKFNVEIDGATSKNFTIPSVEKDDEGWYYGEGLNYEITIRREPIFLIVTKANSTDDISKLDINVFPNPTSDYIQVTRSDNSLKYELFSVTGINISHGDVLNNQIPLGDVAQGHYILKITDGEKMKIIHVVKI